MAGLTKKNGRESGIWEPCLGLSDSCRFFKAKFWLNTTLKTILCCINDILNILFAHLLFLVHEMFLQQIKCLTFWTAKAKQHWKGSPKCSFQASLDWLEPAGRICMTVNEVSYLSGQCYLKQYFSVFSFCFAIWKSQFLIHTCDVIHAWQE